MATRYALALLALVALVGCDSGPSVNPVTGKVTLDGKPIGGAVITFQPVEGGTGKPATGTTDENGVYTLTDMRDKETGRGAEAGDYKVGVMWYKPSGKDTSSSSGSEESADSKAAHQTVSGPSAMLPTHYMNAANSGLTASVKPGKNEFNFDLDSKAKK
ncbi:MAG: carboxypeptidase-like regulatory domain-containing protein [Aureliella sp.]|jgi:hypothetical protein